MIPLIRKQAKTGDPVLSWDDKYLNSSRNPRKEAERIAEAFVKNAGILRRIAVHRPIVFILVDPSLSYISTALKKFYPKARVIAVFSRPDLMDEYREHQIAGRGSIDQLLMAPPLEKQDDTLDSLVDCLQPILEGLGLLSSAVLDWQASSVFPNHEAILKDLSELFRQSQAGLNTQIYFGPVWHRNYVRNIDNSLVRAKHQSKKPVGFPGSIEGPAILLASGPGLQDSEQIVRNASDNTQLIAALPSSLAWLQEKKLQPDLCFSTDGGYWAGVHLRHIQAGTRLMAATTAMVPDTACQNPVHFFSYGLPFESRNGEIPRFPQRGSVLFSAIDVLAALGANPIVVLGADFNHTELQSHVRPHSFDSYLESSSNRLRTLTTIRFERLGGGQLDIYRSWMARNGYSARVIRFRGKHSAPIAGDFTGSLNELGTLLDRLPQTKLTYSVPAIGHRTAKSPQNVVQPLPPKDELHRLFEDRDPRLETYILTNGLELKSAYSEWLACNTQADT